jgi:integrase
MTYYAEYRRGKRIKVGRADAITPYKARALAREVLANACLGKDPAEKPKEDNASTFLIFLTETYKPWILANLRTGEATYINIKRSFPELHSMPLRDISHLDIEKWRTRRLTEGVKPSTVNRALDDLRACLNRAVEWEVIENNPIAKVKRSKIDSNPTPRFLTTSEEKALRQALDDREHRLRAERGSGNKWKAERGYPLLPSLSGVAYADHLKPAVLLSLNTGLRRGELFKLKWSDINFEQNILTVKAETAKSGKTRHIPLNEEAALILKRWKTQEGLKGLHVFINNDGKPFHDVRTAWKGVLDDADIKNFRWHDLRHTFASKLVMAGVDLNTVRELMGHSDYTMTLRYAHLAPEHKAQAVAKLNTVATVT